MARLASVRLPCEGKIPLSVVFYTPNRRCDLDNILASFKSGFDGMADGLGVNDKRFRPLTIDDECDPLNPRVEVTISW